MDVMQGGATVLEECRALATTWAPVLKTFGHAERLLIVLWLADTASTVRELQHVTGLSQSTVSYHLATLRGAGLVVAAAEGRSNRYRLAHPGLSRVAALLGNLGPAGEPAGDGAGR